MYTGHIKYLLAKDTCFVERGNLRPLNPIIVSNQSTELLCDLIDQHGDFIMSYGEKQLRLPTYHFNITGEMKNGPYVLSCAFVVCGQNNKLNMTMILM